jgi:hypothetical protein
MRTETAAERSVLSDRHPRLPMESGELRSPMWPVFVLLWQVEQMNECEYEERDASL